ncbi:glycoside hydrolase family 43 protein [Arcticibacter tournemirensis]
MRRIQYHSFLIKFLILFFTLASSCGRSDPAVPDGEQKGNQKDEKVNPVTNLIAERTYHANELRIAWSNPAGIVSVAISYLQDGGDDKNTVTVNVNVNGQKESSYLLKLPVFAAYQITAVAIDNYGKRSEKTMITATPASTETATFTNPLLSGADPWIIKSEGTYYYTYTQGGSIVVYLTEKVSELGKASPVTLWRPASGTSYSKNLWAPELHKINGKWYVYFAADNGTNANHRMYVIENTSADPVQGSWSFKGKIADPTDQWAIDGTILEHNNQMYMIWSGGIAGGAPQNLYIAKMSNPWTIDGERALISSPEYTWEKYGSAINEGPEILKNSQGDVFLIYSGSGYWVDNYCLGVLKLKPGGDPMLRSDWVKTSSPVFAQNPAAGAYGTGHNAFFKSRDGKEDWIIYHARSLPNGAENNGRNVRIQKFTWNTDGTPNFGEPVKIGQDIKVPSGE